MKCSYNKVVATNDNGYVLNELLTDKEYAEIKRNNPWATCSTIKVEVDEDDCVCIFGARFMINEVGPPISYEVD